MSIYKNGGIDVKPRIFVSSTFYDLKYIRDDLSNFIKSYNFEPIMFEDGDIGYTPDNALDSSCYEAMRSADMVILIIGGQYGSAATGEDANFNEYKSITRKEFQSAQNEGIPIYAFIDSSVYAEYDVYNANFDTIEHSDIEIKFSITKNINVFRFIREVKSVGNIVIIPFDKSTIIKDFLSKQWSDMFKLYLTGLKQQNQIATLQSTVKAMQNYIERMNVMLDSLGRKVLGDDNNIQYNDIIESQTKMELERIAEEVVIGITFGISASQITNHRSFVSEMLDILEQINTDYSDLVDTPQTGISSPQSKRITIEITRKFINAKKIVRMTTVQLVNIIPILKERLTVAKNREYLIELLSNDKLFYQMFEHTDQGFATESAHIVKLN